MTDTPRRIALVTGATNGIGIWTALGLAKDGYVVGIVARDRARGEAMQKRLAEHAPARSVSE
jgi:short-subunit dehydrogenase